MSTLAGRMATWRESAAGLRLRAVGVRRRIVAQALRGGDRVLEVTARPRAFVAPVTDVLTAPAWWLLVLAPLFLIGAMTLGWVELVFAAAFVAALLLLAVLFVLSGHSLKAVLDLTRNRIVVGERANGRMVVSNAGRHGTLPLMIELPVGRTETAFDLPGLKPGAEHEELFAIPTHRRAVLDLGPVRAVRTDPFALLRRDQELTEPDVLYVHPRTVMIEGSAAGFIRDLEGQTIRKISDHDVAFHALREYIPGDDRRFIHWKSTARTGTLMVRQFEETRRSHLLVVLSTRLDDYANDDEFELAVSVAGSLGSQALRDGQTLSATTSTAALRADHASVLLDQYSGVDYEPQAPRLAETLRRLESSISGASVAIFICGSVLDNSELRIARRKLPLDVRSIAIRTDIDADVTLRTMGDVDLMTIGRLDDLSGAMRRLAQ